MLEARLIELLNARLCHDLISPVSAVNNGLELMAEMGDEGGEALALVRQSAHEAARKLQLFRLAFGSARLPNGSDAGLREARAALLDWPLGGRLSLEWPEPLAAAIVPRQGAKLALLLGLVGLDCLGGAGRLVIATAPTEGGVTWRAQASSERAALADDMAEALHGEAALESLTPKTAPAAYAAMQAREIGARIEAVPRPGEVTLACTMPITAK